MYSLCNHTGADTKTGGCTEVSGILFHLKWKLLEQYAIVDESLTAGPVGSLLRWLHSRMDWGARDAPRVNKNK